MLISFAPSLLDLSLDLLPAQKGLTRGDYLCADGEEPKAQGCFGLIGRFYIGIFWHLALMFGGLLLKTLNPGYYDL